MRVYSGAKLLHKPGSIEGGKPKKFTRWQVCNFPCPKHQSSLLSLHVSTKAATTHSFIDSFQQTSPPPSQQQQEIDVPMLDIPQETPEQRDTNQANMSENTQPFKKLRSAFSQSNRQGDDVNLRGGGAVPSRTKKLEPGEPGAMWRDPIWKIQVQELEKNMVDMKWTMSKFHYPGNGLENISHIYRPIP